MSFESRDPPLEEWVLRRVRKWWKETEAAQRRVRALIARRCHVIPRPTRDPTSSSVGPRQAATGKLLIGWPALLEFLSMTSWADGEPRRTGKVTLFTELGRWKATIVDDDAHRVAFLTASDPEELLSRIDDGIAHDDLDWRPAKDWGRPKGR